MSDFDSDKAMHQAPKTVQLYYYKCADLLKTKDPVILAAAIQACAIDALCWEIKDASRTIADAIQAHGI
jgi:hypothetical protein